MCNNRYGPTGSTLEDLLAQAFKGRVISKELKSLLYLLFPDSSGVYLEFLHEDLDRKLLSGARIPGPGDVAVKWFQKKCRRENGSGYCSGEGGFRVFSDVVAAWEAGAIWTTARVLRLLVVIGLAWRIPPPGYR